MRPRLEAHWCFVEVVILPRGMTLVNSLSTILFSTGECSWNSGHQIHNLTDQNSNTRFCKDLRLPKRPVAALGAPAYISPRSYQTGLTCRLRCGPPSRKSPPLRYLTGWRRFSLRWLE